jgi:hypothetical protein
MCDGTDQIDVTADVYVKVSHVICTGVTTYFKKKIDQVYFLNID